MPNNPIMFFEQNNLYINGKLDVLKILKRYGYKNFAIINKNNFFKTSLNGIVGQFFSELSGLLANISYEVEKVHEIKINFCPFVIAIPSKMNKKLPSQ